MKTPIKKALAGSMGDTNWAGESAEYYHGAGAGLCATTAG